MEWGSNKHEHRCLADPQKGIGENKGGQHLIKPDRMNHRQMLWISYNNHQPTMRLAGSSSSADLKATTVVTVREGFLPEQHIHITYRQTFRKKSLPC